MDENHKDEFLAKQKTINEAIRKACSTTIGVLDSAFLCQSVSALKPRQPLCFQEETSVHEIITHLRQHKIGCVLIVTAQQKLSGIFSERDCILKVLEDFDKNLARPVRDFMTPNPVTQPPDATVAFVLNLMSHGGFRHLPIVDDNHLPIGIISIKDIVDFIVNKFTDDLLQFDVTV